MPHATSWSGFLLADESSSSFLPVWLSSLFCFHMAKQKKAWIGLGLVAGGWQLGMSVHPFFTWLDDRCIFDLRFPFSLQLIGR